MVHFGILKEEDAQCYSVQGTIEPGSFALVAAAFLLALLNSFITKSTNQYFLEKKNGDDNQTCFADVESSHHLDGEKEAPVQDGTEKPIRIRLVPVLFTDTYRWLLRGTDKFDESPSQKEFESSNDGEEMGA